MSKQQSTAFKAGTNNSEARDTWVRAKLAALPRGLKLLDAGAGEQRYKKECAHLEYVSQDFCQYEGVGNELGLQTGSWDVSKIDIVCDITQIPLESGSFDCVLCTEVFEHVPDPVGALKELCRLVKKGGCIILTAPITSLTHFAPYHFATGFNRYWYEVHLPSFGFTVEEISQ
jgi:ubiquinone/menaquinone biosynthesis C-methylase UbiE